MLSVYPTLSTFENTVSLSIVEACLPYHCIGTIAARTTYKPASLLLRRVYLGHVFTEPLLSNGYTRHYDFPVVNLVV
jgi:hypothetical protein